MSDYRMVRVFLASPGDVAEERKIAREVLEEVNHTAARDRRMVFQVQGWDSDSYPGYGADGQAIVNRQIGEMSEYDLFVGIMWNRFGTETPRAGSGTEEEFDRASESFQNSGRPDIWLYFRRAPIDLDSEEKLEQKAKVLAFRKRVQSAGLTGEYSTPEEFRRVFHGHVVRWLADTTRQVPEPPPTPQPEQARRLSDGQRAVNGPTVSDSGAWVLLGGNFYLAESVSDRSDGSVAVDIEPQSTDDDAALRSLRPGPYGRGEPIPYAYQNDAFLARVLSAERNSTAGRSSWSVTLKPEQDQGAGAPFEMAFNSISADEIAAMRARLLLLDESPVRSSRDLDGQMLMGLVQGHGPVVRAEKSPFPDLWQQFRGQPDMFLPLARLYAVFLLKASSTVEHVLDLTLGPVQQKRLSVRFRGKRHRQYVNQEPAEIVVNGECPLART
jgi:hypothetical protein